MFTDEKKGEGFLNQTNTILSKTITMRSNSEDGGSDCYKCSNPNAKDCNDSSEVFNDGDSQKVFGPSHVEDNAHGMNEMFAE